MMTSSPRRRCSQPSRRPACPRDLKQKVSTHLAIEQHRFLIMSADEIGTTLEALVGDAITRDLPRLERLLEKIRAERS